MKVTELSAGGTLAGTELLPVVQSGNSVKVTAQAVADLANSGNTFTALVGNTWDGTNKYKTLTANLVLTLSTTRTSGVMYVKQDGTGSHTLSINGTSLSIASGAGTDTAIAFMLVNGEFIISLDTTVIAIIPDTTAPTIASAEAIDANTIVVTFSEAMNTAGTDAGMSFDNGSPLTVTGITWNSGTEAEYAITETMDSADTITYDYDETAGDLEDAAGNDLADDSGSVTNSISGGFDADAQAYIDEVVTGQSGTLDGTAQSGLDTFVTRGKSFGWYSKLRAFHPMAGGNLNAAAVDLINPTTSALTFTGSPSAVSGGISWNGGVDWADTGIDWTALTGVPYLGGGYKTSAAISVFLGTPSPGEFYIFQDDGTGKAVVHIGGGATGIAHTNAAGRYHYQRKNAGSNELEFYRNGSSVGTETSAFSSAGSSANILYNKVYATITATSHITAYGFVSAEMSGAEVADLDDAITDLLTALGR